MGSVGNDFCGTFYQTKFYLQSTEKAVSELCSTLLNFSNGFTGSVPFPEALACSYSEKTELKMFIKLPRK